MFELVPINTNFHLSYGDIVLAVTMPLFYVFERNGKTAEKMSSD